MRFFHLLALFPFGCAAQFPIDTDNEVFQISQQQKMLKLGLHRIDVKSVDYETETGKRIRSGETWSTFDDRGNCTGDGFRNKGKDSIQYIRSYDKDNKYLGEVDANGNGREFFYDEHDSLIRIQYIPDNPFSILFFYDQLNDSTTRVREYYSDTLHIESARTYVRSGNTVYCTTFRHGEQYLDAKKIANASGQIVETWDRHNDCTQRYTYDSLGRTIKWEIDQTYNTRKENWEFVRIFDSNGNLIFEQKKEKNQGVKDRWNYEFKNGLLVKETQFNPYDEPNECITIYSFYPNGLVKSSTKIVGYNGEYKNVQTYTYK